MNSESPFRISIRVLTIGCILCGITAASYLAAQFTPRRNSAGQKTVAASGQNGKRSEFHLNRSRAPAPNHRTSVASQTQLLSASNSPNKASASATQLQVPTETAQANPNIREMTLRPDDVETTAVEHGMSPFESEGHLVPKLYAPVNVQPVIVNIDHADIIREISRVHERLDLLSAEARAAHSRATPHDAVATTPVQHSDVQPDEDSSQNRLFDEQTNDISPHRISVANPAVAPPLASVPEPMPEFPFEMTPHQSAAGIPIFEPPAAEPEAFETEAFETEAFETEAFETEAMKPEIFEPDAAEPETFVPEDMESASILSIEFSAEAFAIPERKEAADITPQNDAQFLEIPVSDFFEPKASAAAPVPVHWPVLPGVATLSVPGSQSAKRTTDPPFMSGRGQPVPALSPPAANDPGGTMKIEALRPVSRMRPVPRTTYASGKHATQTDCKNCKVAKQAGNSKDRSRPVTPSNAFRRIMSALSH